MQTLRQTAAGIVYVVVSLALVVGALALAVAQGWTPAPPPSAPTALPPATNTHGAATRPASATAPAVTPASASATTQAAATSTFFYPSAVATRKSTATAKIACGPPTGWVKAYVVEAGDTLYRIATLHGITVAQLQRANCKSGTLILVGEKLWVPYGLPPATELTIIPTFPTPTEPATPTGTATATPTATPTQQQ